MSLADPLINYLRQLERQGQTHVYIDEHARQTLRTFYSRAHKTSTSPAPRLPQTTAPSPPPLTSPSSAIAPSIPTGTATQALHSLRSQLIDANLPKTVGTLRDKLVFSTGSAQADIMFVGEAPGHYDEDENAPFAGPAGKKFDGLLKAMGLTRSAVYLTHLVKYRPATSNQTLNGRQPNAAEIAASLPWLETEIAIVKPKVIVALGSIAATTLIGTAAPVKDLLGQFYRYQNIPLRVTHPISHLLQHLENADKRIIWEDMLAIMELLQLPISDKQRGYFSSAS